MWIDSNFNIGEEVYVVKEFKFNKDAYSKHSKGEKAVVVTREKITKIILVNDVKGNTLTLYETDGTAYNDPISEEYLCKYDCQTLDKIIKALNKEEEKDEQIQEM